MQQERYMQQLVQQLRAHVPKRETTRDMIRTDLKPTRIIKLFTRIIKRKSMRQRMEMPGDSEEESCNSCNKPQHRRATNRSLMPTKDKESEGLLQLLQQLQQAATPATHAVRVEGDTHATDAAVVHKALRILQKQARHLASQPLRPLRSNSPADSSSKAADSSSKAAEITMRHNCQGHADDDIVCESGGAAQQSICVGGRNDCRWSFVLGKNSLSNNSGIYTYICVCMYVCMCVCMYIPLRWATTQSATI
jgi:hypothetical protein